MFCGKFEPGLSLLSLVSRSDREKGFKQCKGKNMTFICLFICLLKDSYSKS